MTKLDKNSEAARRCGRRHPVSVQDLDGILPVETPGKEIVVCQDNYQTSLSLVRAMRHCRLTFQADGLWLTLAQVASLFLRIGKRCGVPETC